MFRLSTIENGSVARAPQWLAKHVVGTERSSILLEGQSVRPRRTLASGYRFRFADFDAALDDLVTIAF